MADPEQTLIRRAQKGDQDAFAVLVEEHQRYIYNLALRVLKDENEALDLSQETFCARLDGPAQLPRSVPIPDVAGIVLRPTCAITACPTCAAH